MQDDEKTLLTRAKNLGYRFLNLRPRTIKEMRDYMHKKAKEKPRYYSFDEKIIEKIIQDLHELKLLDDKAFTEWFVRYRTLAKPKGTYALKQELKKFGVPQDIVDAFFDKNPVNEVELAVQTLRRRLPRLKDIPYLKRQKKIYDFLSRRGFSYDTIKKAIESIRENT